MQRLTTKLFGLFAAGIAVLLFGAVPSLAQITVSLPNTTGASGSSGTVAVTVDDLDGENVLSFDFTVSFDPAVVEVTGYDPSGTISEDMTITSSSTENSFRVVAASGAALEGSGTLINLLVDFVGAGDSDLEFTEFTFNEGTPAADPQSGSVSIPDLAISLPHLNAAPGQSLTIPVTTQDLSGEGVLSFDFTVEFDSDVVTIDGYDASGTLSDGMTITSSTTANTIRVVGASASELEGDGVLINLTGTAEGQGVSPLTFAELTLNEGTPAAGTVNGSVTVSGAQVDFQANLAGVNEVPPVSSTGSGTANIAVEGDSVIVTGSFMNLISDVATQIGGGAHIHVGAVGENGPVVIPLVVSLAEDNRSGTFEAEENTFVLGELSFPDGIDADSVLSAIENGNAYVNVHTEAHNPGEIRGQILGVDNSPPSASEITSPEEGDVFVIEGDPEDVLVSIETTEAEDPDGNSIVYMLQIAADETFAIGSTLTSTFDGPPGAAITVGEAASLFDEVTGSEPGSIPVGTSVDVYLRVVTTDGSEWTAGSSVQIEVTRGEVTSNEKDSQLPTAFTLQGNYPNPFNPSTTIRFDLPASASVSVDVFDLLGRNVMSVPSQAIQAGAARSLEIDAANLSSGTYVYRVVAESVSETMVQTGKMTLIK